MGKDTRIGRAGGVARVAVRAGVDWRDRTYFRVIAESTVAAKAPSGACGLTHLATWALVAAGMVLTVRAWQRRELAPPWRTHLGLVLAGWGVFDVAEGLVDHQLLGIHHVRDDIGAPLGWDLAFLAFGLLLSRAGWR